MVSVGGVVAQAVTQKSSAVNEPVINYFDPTAEEEPCESCEEVTSQSCQTNETDFPCLCKATSGSETGNMVQAHLDDNQSSECTPLYRSIQP
ncbi:hypothetical protein [Parapedobacter sp.]|uniref:hypothetical protein n=1 Tax=Parapedobacter sp. TaxID=1958893 RepID=UPI002D7E8C88|nr:hypothetical protein [Parapedobacter sp.]